MLVRGGYISLQAFLPRRFVFLGVLCDSEGYGQPANSLFEIVILSEPEHPAHPSQSVILSESESRRAGMRASRRTYAFGLALLSPGRGDRA